MLKVAQHVHDLLGVVGGHPVQHPLQFPVQGLAVQGNVEAGRVQQFIQQQGVAGQIIGDPATGIAQLDQLG